MHLSKPVDGFKLAYDRHGAGDPVVLLHGWPGSRTDWRKVVPLLQDSADVIVPDLRGFGHSDKHLLGNDADYYEKYYSPRAQAASVIGLIEEFKLPPVVLAGYDVGSLVAQTVASMRPELSKRL